MAVLKSPVVSTPPSFRGDALSRTRNPSGHGDADSWIPGSRYARPGMTVRE
jgi:hypothetical protein